MIDLTKLESGTLKAIAQAYGVEVDKQAEFVLPPDVTAKLAAMHPIDLLRLYTQWHLGSRGWADDFVDVWTQVNQPQP